MKTRTAMIVAPALALTFSLGLIGCAESSSGPDAAIAQASNKVQANIAGMDCGGCTSSVCTAVEQVAGVTGAHADLKTGKLTVALEDGADAEAAAKEIETVVAGLSKGKFTISDITTTTATDDAAPAEDDADPAQEPAEDAEQASTVEHETHLVSAHTYKVDGMDCTGCSGSIEEAVQQIAGVKNVKANHEDGLVVIAYDSTIDEEAKEKEVKAVIAALSGGKFTVQ